MSHVMPFAAGLGGGLALWQVLQSAPVQRGPNAPAVPASRNCALTVDRAGIEIDGERVDVAEAVRRCQATGRAVVSVAPNAPAATYAALLTALGSAGVPTYRNGRGDTRTAFTLITYPRGHEATSTSRWFRAEAPITWTEARDRLIAAGIIDPALAGRTHEAGGWMLSIDPAQFSAERAEPLPGAPRNSYISTTFTLVVYPDGVGGPKTTRWFRANAPTTWDDACARLADAGHLDPSATLPMHSGYWILISAPGPFNEARAEPLPPRRGRNVKPLPEARRPRGAARASRYALDGGRTIVRDGEALVRLERVDLGNERYALSPHQTDQFGHRLVRLLNKHGAR